MNNMRFKNLKTQKKLKKNKKITTRDNAGRN